MTTKQLPPHVLPEYDWLANARRRDAGIKRVVNSFDATIHDRRNLLTAYDQQELEIMQLRGQLRDAETIINELSRK